MTLRLAGSTLQQLPNQRASRDVRRADPHSKQPFADRVDGLGFHPFRKTRFTPDQPPELRPQEFSERAGKRGQQNPGVRVGAREKNGTVHRHNRLAGARRTANTNWATVVPLYYLPLGRMKEHRPLVPGVVQGALQFGRVLHSVETTPGIGVLEWVGTGYRPHGFPRFAVPHTKRPLIG